LVQANNFGYNTGIQIQNTSGSPTNVTITYTPAGAGTACTETKTIPNNNSVTFALFAWNAGDGNADNTCVNGERFVGSAQITTNSASAGLVGIVNQVHDGAGKGAAYGAFNPANATNIVVMPLIADRNFGYYTGFNIQNVGGSTTNVACTFSGSSVTIPSTPIAAGTALNSVQGANPGWLDLGSGYVGSATCTASGGVENKIIGVVNYVNDGGVDTFMVYEATNQ
jgi:hypothetical protein